MRKMKQRFCSVVGVILAVVMVIGGVPFWGQFQKVQASGASTISWRLNGHETESSNADLESFREYVALPSDIQPGQSFSITNRKSGYGIYSLTLNGVPVSLSYNDGGYEGIAPANMTTPVSAVVDYYAPGDVSLDETQLLEIYGLTAFDTCAAGADVTSIVACSKPEQMVKVKLHGGGDTWLTASQYQFQFVKKDAAKNMNNISLQMVILSSGIKKEVSVTSGSPIPKVTGIKVKEGTNQVIFQIDDMTNFREIDMKFTHAGKTPGVFPYKDNTLYLLDSSYKTDGGVGVALYYGSYTITYRVMDQSEKYSPYVTWDKPITISTPDFISTKLFELGAGDDLSLTHCKEVFSEQKGTGSDGLTFSKGSIKASSSAVKGDKKIFSGKVSLNYDTLTGTKKETAYTYSYGFTAQVNKGGKETAQEKKMAASIGTVKGIKAKQTGKKIKLTFKKKSGVTGYQIFRKTSPKGKFKKIKVIKKNKASYTDTVKGKCSYYYYRVRPYKKIKNVVYFGTYSKTLKVKYKK